MTSDAYAKVLTFYPPEAFFYLHALFVNGHDFRWIPLIFRQVAGQQPGFSFTDWPIAY